MNFIEIPAPAKINLALDIKGLRADGYHQVEIIMQSIHLHDKVRIGRPETCNDINISTSHPQLSDGQENLAYQAVKAIRSYTGKKIGAEIDIKKNIPVAAGLAGGSTDAAAVLKGLNKLYELKLTRTELRGIAAGLGADVPFCLEGGTALAQGIGDELEQLTDLPPRQILLVSPPIQISTASIYREFDNYHPDLEVPVSQLKNIINQQNSLDIDQGWANVLEPVTCQKTEEVKRIKELLIEKGCDFTLMTGSGPTVYSLMDSRNKAEEIKNSWPDPDDLVICTSTIKKDFFEISAID